MTTSGQVVIVTGGASGIGLAVAHGFVAQGASVVLLDRDEAKLAIAVRQLGPCAVAVVGDVCAFADNERAVATAVKRFGRLDTFIANAGVFDFGTALADLPEDRLGPAFDEVFGINVKGTLLGAKAAVPELVRSRGALILTLSAAARHAACGGVLYTASKHALVGIVKQLAFELAPHVRVNGVAPGATRTTLSGPSAIGLDRRSVSELLPPDEVARQFEPLGRFAAPEEHVGPYLLLASRDEGSTITGEVIYAHSGASIRGITEAAGGWHLAERFESTKSKWP